jgi:hypothetical protein
MGEAVHVVEESLGSAHGSKALVHVHLYMDMHQGTKVRVRGAMDISICNDMSLASNKGYNAMCRSHNQQLTVCRSQGLQWYCE